MEITPETWTLPQLQKAFSNLIDRAGPQLRMCFFIDGLDEYYGDVEDIAQHFREASKKSQYAKFCLSSRPWPEFLDIFQGMPGLKLQDLIYDDIKLYVHDKLEKNKHMQQLLKDDPKNATQLVHELISKAVGVFLWVVLVVKSLTNGLRNGDGIAHLQSRLASLPSDLENLYEHMINCIEPLYIQEAAQIIQIFRASRNSLDIMTLERAIRFSDYRQAVEMQIEKVNEKEDNIESKDVGFERMELRLNSRCKGLLEVLKELNETHSEMENQTGEPQLRTACRVQSESQTQTTTPNGIRAGSLDQTRTGSKADISTSTDDQARIGDFLFPRLPQIYLCPVMGCPRSRGAGYTSKYKLTGHLWRQHTTAGQKRTADRQVKSESAGTGPHAPGYSSNTSTVSNVSSATNSGIREVRDRKSLRQPVTEIAQSSSELRTRFSCATANANDGPVFQRPKRENHFGVSELVRLRMAKKNEARLTDVQNQLEWFKAQNLIQDPGHLIDYSRYLELQLHQLRAMNAEMDDSKTALQSAGKKANDRGPENLQRQALDLDTEMPGPMEDPRSNPTKATNTAWKPVRTQNALRRDGTVPQHSYFPPPNQNWFPPTEAPTSFVDIDTERLERIKAEVPHISYLHRTVKYYIERPEVWERLVQRTNHFGFDPHTALLAAYVIELKTMSLVSKAKTIYDCGIEILSRCGALEPSGSRAHIELVDELDRVGSVRSADHDPEHWHGHWSNLDPACDSTTIKKRLELKSDILNMAMKSNMNWYIKAKLASTDFMAVKTREGLPLLAFALGFDSWGLGGKATIPSYNNVQLLLDNGANPNEMYEWRTIWQYTIHYVHILNDMEAKLPDFPCWMKIFKLMLEHGADPYACCIREDSCDVGWARSDAYACIKEGRSDFGWAYSVGLKKDGEMGYDLASIRDHTLYRIKPWPGEGDSLDDDDPNTRHEQHHSVTAVVNDVFRRRGVPGVDDLIKVLEEAKQAAGMREKRKRKKKNRVARKMIRPNWIT